MNQGSHKKNQQGAAVLEFAIVLPVIIILAYGIVEFGILMYNKAVITNASREGARVASIYDAQTSYYTDEAIQQAVENCLKWDGSNSTLINLGGPEPKPGVRVFPPNVADRSERSTAIAVTVSYDYDFLLIPGFIPGIPGDRPLTLTATTTMRRE